MRLYRSLAPRRTLPAQKYRLLTRKELLPGLDRPLGRHPGGQQTCPDGNLRVSYMLPSRVCTSSTPPIRPPKLRRQPLLVQIEPADGIVVKYAEEAGGVVDVVHRYPVEQDQVMARFATLG